MPSAVFKRMRSSRFTARTLSLLGPVWAWCKLVTLGVLSGLLRRFGIHELEDTLERLPLRAQLGVVVTTFAALGAASVLAASFGLIGLAVFFLAVVLIVN